VTRVTGRPLVWLHGEVRSPPLSRAARLEAGWLLRRLQLGEPLGLPHSRPLLVVGARCHELRVVDRDATWRIVYRVDPDAIIIAGVFSKKTRATPRALVEACTRRLRTYDMLSGERG
jgi:phage-related protein